MGAKNRRKKARCRRKMTLDKQRAAELAWGMRNRGNMVFHYKCEFCKQYHIGHRPAKVRQAIRDKKANSVE